MRRPSRIAALIVGQPGSGKTTFERKWTDRLVSMRGVDSVFVLDVVFDKIWDDAGPIARSLVEYRSICRDLGKRRNSEFNDLIPRRVVWRFNSVYEYRVAIAEAIDQGNVVLVFCEASYFFPVHPDRWPIRQVETVCGVVSLESVIRLGRAHLQNRYRDPCVSHYLADTQYPADVHRLVRDVSSTVVTSKIEGEIAFRWIRGNFGDDRGVLAEKVRKLAPFEWLALRGALPSVGAP